MAEHAGRRGRRPDGDDAGGRAGFGRGRCRHRRTTRHAWYPDRARAGGLHARTIEVLDQRGRRSVPPGGEGRCASRDSAESPWTSAFPLPPQPRARDPRIHERAAPGDLARRAGGADHPRTQTGFTQDDGGVDALSDGTSIRAGLPGRVRRRPQRDPESGRYRVRRVDPSTSWFMAEVEMVERPEFGLRPGGGIGPTETGDGHPVVLTERQVEHTGEPTLEDVREAPPSPPTGRTTACTACSGRPVSRTSPGRPRRIARARPPGGRCGTRASPARWSRSEHRCPGCREPGVEAGPGGQGDISPEPAGHLPRGTSSGRRPGVAEHDGPGRPDQPRRPSPGPARHHERAAQHGRAAQEPRRPDVGSRHPLRPRTRSSLLGRRMPDLDIATADGPLRVYEFLHVGRPMLLNFDLTACSTSLRGPTASSRTDAEYDGPWSFRSWARWRPGRRADPPGRVRRMGGR